MPRPEHPDMIYRELGTTGERVSAIGLGGFHLAKDPSTSAHDAINLVRSAADAGITFMDNCWDYNKGVSEIRMGLALQDGYRDKVFLMTKLDARTAEDYNKQLEQSLRRLQTDVIDLVQFHEILRFEDPDRIFAEDGAIHAAIEARKAGKLRYIGFTGHKDPQIHLRMFEIAERNGFHFDTVQMPVNAFDAHFRSFTKKVIPVAQKHGTAVLAMKTFGDGYILRSHTIDPIEALHYGLSQPVSVVITGIDRPEILDQALTAAKHLPALHARTDRSLPRQDPRRRAHRQIRALQDLQHLRRHRQQPQVARRHLRHRHRTLLARNRRTARRLTPHPARPETVSCALRVEIPLRIDLPATILLPELQLRPSLARALSLARPHRKPRQEIHLSRTIRQPLHSLVAQVIARQARSAGLLLAHVHPHIRAVHIGAQEVPLHPRRIRLPNSRRIVRQQRRPPPLHCIL